MSSDRVKLLSSTRRAHTSRTALVGRAQERRRRRRIDSAVGVQLVDYLHQPKPQRTSISESGMFIHTRRRCSVGQMIGVALTAPRLREPILLKARVVRIVPNDGDPASSGIGVEFVNVPPAEQALLRELVGSAAGRSCTSRRADRSRPRTRGNAVGARDDVTGVGLPRLHLRFNVATNGAAGLVEVEAEQVQLSGTQLAFLRLLCDRMSVEVDQADVVRGYVSSEELLELLDWKTPHPDDSHVKQLVRRVRRALSRAGIGNLIDSRRGFGYRLCAVPEIPAD